MPNEIADLDGIIESIEIKQIDDREIADFFHHLVGPIDTYKNLEEITWYAHQNGKSKVARALAWYLSNHYSDSNYRGLETDTQGADLSYIRREADSGDMFRKAAKLKREILGDDKRAEEYEKFANMADEIVKSDEESNKKICEIMLGLGYHDSELVLVRNNERGKFYKRRDELNIPCKEIEVKEKKQEPIMQKITLHGPGGSVSVEALRDKDVDIEYCSKCGGISNINRAFLGLDIHQLNTFGCSCP